MAAAAEDGDAQGREEERPAGDLDQRGEPEALPAVDEVDPQQERPAGADEDEAGAEYDQR